MSAISPEARRRLPRRSSRPPRRGSPSRRQLQLTWWRFRKHKLAVASGVVVILFYLVALFADFLATTDPHATEATRSYIPPQAIHWFDETAAFRAARLRAQGPARPAHLQARLRARPDRQALPRAASRDGYPYKLFGLIQTNRHLLGLDRRQARRTRSSSSAPTCSAATSGRG